MSKIRRRPIKRHRYSKHSRLRIVKIIIPLLAILALLFYFLILKDLPSPNKLSSPDFSPSSTRIFDRNGQLLYEIYVGKNRSPIKLSELPPIVKWATIAAEDKNFYSHKGFAVTGIIRAAFNTVFRRHLEGGSTISQQLVKITLLSQDRTIKRKIREAILTVALELKYSKDQILEMYLNQVPYGGTTYGIGAASQYFFAKDASELTLAEAALIAGLPASPTRYSPFGNNPELAKQRQEYILDEMVNSKFISREEANQAKEEKPNYSLRGSGIKAPHFVMYVKDLLVEKYGQKTVEGGGLQVTTTLDLAIQDLAQNAVATEVAKLTREKVTNGAALVTNPKTGEVLAMVGSKDYFATDITGNYNVTTALRQPGSSIKPVNYAIAIDRKIITPATVLLDQPTCFLNPGQKTYCPDNYDRRFHGLTQVRFALGNSYNIPAVKTLALNGLTDFIASASAFGLTSYQDPQKYGLSLSLGGGETRMTEMATAFGVLANSGRRQDLTTILKVTDAKGDNLEAFTPSEGTHVLSPETAYLISHILYDPNARSAMFGTRSFLSVKNHPEVSVKTGTTNDKKDNWTIGYTGSYVVTVWVGNNDNKPMSAVASGVTGASPIWNNIMSTILQIADAQNGKTTQEWITKPDSIVGASICTTTGQLPGDSGCPTRFEFFLPGTVPTETPSRKDILINKTNGTPVQPGQNLLPEIIEIQNHPSFTDLTGEVYCLDCPMASASATLDPNNLKYKTYSTATQPE